MVLIHWGYVLCFQSIGDALLGSLCSLSTKEIFVIFRCIFETSFALPTSWELHRDIYFIVIVFLLNYT